MPILDEAQQALWDRIRHYTFDEDLNAPVTFLSKLKKEQQWYEGFANRAIEEYKRFVFLCCVIKEGASPSHVVDQVWHLHLTYTKTYWHQFCLKVLQKELHHYPSNGIKETDEKLQEKYLATLQAYHSYFDELPPLDIWPNGQLDKAIQKSEVFPDKYKIWLLIAVIGGPFLFKEFWMFDLTGPEFLTYFFLVMLIGWGTTLAYLLDRKDTFKAFIEKYLSKKINIYHQAFHFYDKHHALQAALLNLMDNGLVVVTKQKTMEIALQPIPDTDVHLAVNPLRNKPSEYKKGEVLSYDTLMETWYRPSDFEEVTLYHALEARKPSKVFIPFFIVIGLGLLRFGQGLYHHRPVFYLVLEIFIYLIGHLVLVTDLTNRRNAILDVLKKRLPIDLGKNVLAQRYVLDGRGILASVGFGIFIADVFPRFNKSGNRMNSNCTGGSCSSSGCSGSSCSSGGDGGGGGCGGCGGGD